MRGRGLAVLLVGCFLFASQGVLVQPVRGADPLDGLYTRTFGYPSTPIAQCTIVQGVSEQCIATWSMSRSSVRVFFHSEFHATASAYGGFRLEWLDGSNRVVYDQTCLKFIGADWIDDWADVCFGSTYAQKHVHLSGSYNFGTQKLRLTLLDNGWCGGLPCELHGAIYIA